MDGARLGPVKHHANSMADRFKALVAYDPLAGLHHKKRRRDGGRVNITDHVNEQAKVVDTDPSDGQKEAGNYRKGHVKVHGLDVSIENPRGSWREGGPPDKRWRSRLPHHYGYIRKTEGGDGDHVDVYLGPHLKSPHVFVIDQHHLDGKGWDEHKSFIGFGSKAQATDAYHRAFSDGKGKDRIGHVESMTIDEFKDWLKNADTTQPVKGHRERFAAGGAVDDDHGDMSGKERAEKALPPDHQLGMRIPKGGSMCARCEFLSSPTTCGNKGFVEWNGGAKLPDPADEYCCDLYEIAKPERADGGRVHMAAGGTMSDADMGITAPAMSDADMGIGTPAKASTPASGGVMSYVPKAITDIPHEIYQAGAESIGGVKNMWDTMQARHAEASKKPFFDPSTALDSLKDVADVGKGVVSAAALPAAPLVGTARSSIGHPMADAEHIVGSIINPDVAAKDDPNKMYAAAKGDVDLALSAARPRGFTAKGPVSTPPPVAPEALANTDTANEFGISLSRGQATQDLDTIRYEDMAARGAYGPEAQKKAAEFFQKQFEDTQTAGRSVGQQTARTAPVVDNPTEAASAVSGDVADRAARARALQGNVDQQATAEADAQRGIVSDQGRALDESIRGGALPIENPREAGEVVGQNVREAAAANRQEFRDRYNEFGQLPGQFDVSAVRGMGNRVRNELTYGDNPVVIDDHLTPAASRAIQALDEMSAPRIQNRASPHAEPNPEEIASVSLQGVDQMRKQLVSYYQAARSSNNAADIRAMRGVMNGFDGQIERAITENLFSGDPRALEALQEARASYSRYQRTFTPQGAGDDVGTAMRRIVDRNATPEETANMIIGSGKIGNAGLPVRIADRLEQVLGADSDSWSAIRQAMWQKASQVRNAAGAIDPARSASSIADFTGSSLARRMFTDQELRAMRSHAQGIRDLDRNIEQLPATQTAERVRQAYQDTFGGAELGGAPRAAFQKMVEGTATPEEIANGVFKVIGAGNPGHVTRTLQAIERIVGPDSPAMGAIRQGVWQKLTQAAAGKDQPGAQKAMQAINEFLHGSGRTIAEQLYSPQELALMDRYQKALKLTIIPKYARTNSDTAPALLAAVRKYAGMIGGALGLVHGDGGFAGYGVGKLLDAAGGKLKAVKDAKKLSDSLNNVVPPPVKPITSPKIKSARILPLSVRGGPTNNIGAAIARLQGPTPASADQKQQ